MRNVCINILSAGDSLTTIGSQIDANQLVSASFHAYFGDIQAGGTFKLQISNDVCAFSNVASQFSASHWVDLPNQSATIVAGASALLTVANMSYRWIRAVYTSTATGSQNVTVHADASNSLQSKYFLLNAPNSGTKYYVWYNVSGGGTDPAVAGRTAIEVDISTGDSANTVASATATAIALISAFSGTTATLAVVNILNTSSGPFVPASDFNTGFTFAIAGGGSSTVQVNMNALSI